MKTYVTKWLTVPLKLYLLNYANVDEKHQQITLSGENVSSKILFYFIYCA
jgi:hypothetical protein